MDDFPVDHEPFIPAAEELGFSEKALRFGKDVLRSLVRNTEAFTGTPDAQQVADRGVSQLEDYANSADS
jgi:hypothetical protein